MMARQVVEVLTCDACSATEDVLSWSITRNNRTVEVDLCPDHSHGIAEAYAQGHPPNARAGRGRTPQHAVVPMDDD